MDVVEEAVEASGIAEALAAVAACIAEDEWCAMKQSLAVAHRMYPIS